MRVSSLIFTAIVSAYAYAGGQIDDKWECTQTGTTRHGSSWYTCGVAQADTEDRARLDALNHALDEFRAFCALQTGCQNADKDVQPQRTTCLTNQYGWKCYRSVVVTTN